jgi:hypothetical protein
VDWKKRTKLWVDPVYITAARQASEDTLCPDPIPGFPHRDDQDDYDRSMVQGPDGVWVHFMPEDCLMLFGYGRLKIAEYNSAGDTWPGP